MKKHMIRLVSLLLIAATMTVCFAGCKKDGEGSVEVPEGFTKVRFAASYVTAELQDVYDELVKTYNEGQGKTDKIVVELKKNPGAIGNLNTQLAQKKYDYDVVQIADNEFKALVLTGKQLFKPLDEFLTDEAKTAMQWDQIPESLVNRFRMDLQPTGERLYMAGEGASLLALPNGSDPQVLFYNKKIMQDCGINIVSVPEAELEAYNTENSAKLVPHGYAEYKEAPFAGAVSSQNEAGATVYKVFNECIAMNWEEQYCLARAFQNQYGKEYGYMSEWWFNYGFSVGGDCIGWDEASGQYVFTLLDKQANYLAVADITVNGHSYKQGEVLGYEDKTFLNSNAAELAKVADKVAELPSQYDAILEFTRYGVPADKQVESGINGYGIAPSTTANRDQKFLGGNNALLVEDFSKITTYKKTMGDDLGIAMPAQYRSYVSGSTYNGFLKVIGETYDGAVYTGELEYKNDVAIVGEAATESSATGLFLPVNTESKAYAQAFTFASWVAGPEGQKILAKGNKTVPNQVSYGMSDEYNQDAARPISNMWAGAYLSQNADIGDYAYFVGETWIAEWSQTFNKDVREGKMTMSQFISEKKEVADKSLKTMRLRMLGR